MVGNINLSFGSKSDSGKVKEFNSDSIIDFPILNGHVFVLCDGHDGDQGHGALAAKLTVDSIKKYFYNRSYKDLHKALTNAVSYANYSVFEQSQKDSKYAGMGSTIALLIHSENKIYYAYAGDSRIYLFKEGQLQPLTRDHIDDHENLLKANVEVLVGKDKDIKFGVCKQPLNVNENDLFLICSDGLTDYLTDKELIEILSDENTAPAHKAVHLIDAANEKGGNDNVSVHVVEFTRTIKEEKKAPTLKVKNILVVLAVIIGLLVVVFGAYKGIEYLTNNKENPTKTSKKLNQEEIVKAIPTEVEKKETNKSIKVRPENEKNIAPKEKNQEIKKDKIVPAKLDLDEPVYYNHHVKFGENLYRLSLRYNVSQQKIIDLNKTKAKNLIAGSYLKIPVKSIYYVKKGDSYSVVSDRFNVKINLICTANKIDKTQPLREGQKLIIPLP